LALISDTLADLDASEVPLAPRVCKGGSDAKVEGKERQKAVKQLSHREMPCE